MRQTIKTAMIVLVVAGLSMTGLALAQQGDEAPAAEQTRPDFKANLRDQLQALVDAGTITPAQADAVADHLSSVKEERMAERLQRREDRQADRQAVLDLLGVTGEELHQAFAEGKSLTQVAEDQGVAIQDVIDLMVTQAETRLAAAVTDGYLTQDEADQRLADITERITDGVNRVPGEGVGPGHGGHRFGPHGPGGFGPGGAGGFAPGGFDEAPAVGANV